MPKVVFSKQKGTPPKPGHEKKKSKPNKQPPEKNGSPPPPIKQKQPSHAESTKPVECLQAGRIRGSWVNAV